MYYKNALNMYHKSADQGNALAQLSLGIISPHTPPFPSRSHLTFLFPLSLMLISIEGHMYAAGKGCPFDNDKAFDWYLKSATQGNASAQYNIGKRGRGNIYILFY